MTLGGNTIYTGGALDSAVVKAGFTYSLGAIKKPTQISLKEKKVMQSKIENLTAKNQKLEARLEVLEMIPLGEIPSEDLASNS